MSGREFGDPYVVTEPRGIRAEAATAGPRVVWLRMCLSCGNAAAAAGSRCPACRGPLGEPYVGALPEQDPPPVRHERLLYVVIGLMLGATGAHNFSVGRVGAGVRQAMATTVAVTLTVVAFVVNNGYALDLALLCFVLIGLWVLVELAVVKDDGAGNRLA